MKIPRNSLEVAHSALSEFLVDAGTDKLRQLLDVAPGLPGTIIDALVQWEIAQNMPPEKSVRHLVGDLAVLRFFTTAPTEQIGRLRQFARVLPVRMMDTIARCERAGIHSGMLFCGYEHFCHVASPEARAEFDKFPSDMRELLL